MTDGLHECPGESSYTCLMLGCDVFADRPEVFNSLTSWDVLTERLHELFFIIITFKLCGVVH